jgi:hypothetical protein
VEGSHAAIGMPKVSEVVLLRRVTLTALALALTALGIYLAVVGWIVMQFARGMAEFDGGSPSVVGTRRLLGSWRNPRRRRMGALDRS